MRTQYTRRNANVYTTHKNVTATWFSVSFFRTRFEELCSDVSRKCHCKDPLQSKFTNFSGNTFLGMSRLHFTRMFPLHLFELNHFTFINFYEAGIPGTHS